MPRIDDFLTAMMELDGSDLHLCVGLSPKIRIHGELEELDEPPLMAEDMEAIMSEICPPDKWEFFLDNRDLDFAYEIRDLARFRTNFFNNHFGIGCVCRIIPTKIQTLEDLHLPEVLKEVCQYTSGLVLVTGPTGSGKSTTLAAMIDFINVNLHRHIITIEDPIEFVHMNKQSVIVQREVGTDTETFSAALRGSMRADPDIVLVGEMRDFEAISTALTAAETGHLVLATMHSPNVAHALERIVGVFEGSAQRQIVLQLSNALQGIISQELLPAADRTRRILAYELLVATGAVRNLIRENQIHHLENILQTGRKEGMVLMDNCLHDLYCKCLISYDTAISRARHPEGITRQKG